MKVEALFDIKGKLAVVTGGGAGIGRAYVEAMVDNGADVMVMDRDAAAVEQTRKELHNRGCRVDGVVVDVSDRKAVKAAFDETIARFGRLDIVFANAGISAGPGFLEQSGARSTAGALEGIPDELWDQVVATNLTSVFSTIRAVAPQMKKQRSGRIIVTSSIAGLRPTPAVGTPYLIAKSGIAHLVKQAALELAKYGITVNAIMPGPFLTSLTTPELKQVFERNSPMHRVATTDEIQGLALFLASPASSYVTGTHMVIDGGSMLGRAD
jgi:NAD(P)-dependent dehydrogenase (short-subunit alcohol dehydrogenase family)